MELDQYYERMRLIRVFEENLLELFSKGELFGTTHTCIGQEADAVGVLSNITRDDIVFSNHRCHGHFLAIFDDPEPLMAELMGRATGVCAGRGGSQHLQRENFYTNGIQGGIVPISAGMALAEKAKKSGRIVVVFIGDGTLGEGTVYETLNLAALWKLPLLFVCENNRYAQSTPINLGVAGSIIKRPEAFGVQCAQVEASEIETVLAAASTAVEHVRKKREPYWLLLETYRFAPHSKGDDVRSKEELEKYRAADPLLRLRAKLSEEQANALDERCAQRVAVAIQAARAAPWPKGLEG